MKAEIKYLHSPDVSDLETYQPKELDNFGFLLQIFVGPKGEKGEENFDVLVGTQKWLASPHNKTGTTGEHDMVVSEYNYEKLLETLKKQIESIEGKDWNDLAEKIGKIGKWEFENYKE